MRWRHLNNRMAFCERSLHRRGEERQGDRRMRRNRRGEERQGDRRMRRNRRGEERQGDRGTRGQGELILVSPYPLLPFSPSPPLSSSPRFLRVLCASAVKGHLERGWLVSLR